MNVYRNSIFNTWNPRRNFLSFRFVFERVRPVRGDRGWVKGQQRRRRRRRRRRRGRRRGRGGRSVSFEGQRAAGPWARNEFSIQRLLKRPVVPSSFLRPLSPRARGGSARGDIIPSRPCPLPAPFPLFTRPPKLLENLRKRRNERPSVLLLFLLC